MRRAHALALILCPATALAQVPTVRLSGSGTTVEYEFDRLGSARELANRLLVAVDLAGGALLRIDFESNTVSQIGSKGGGPQEYRQLGRLHCAPNDSSLVDDRQLGRWILLKGDRIVSSEVIVDRLGYNPVLAGADDYGRVLEVRPFRYGHSPGVPRLEYHATAESMLVILNYRTSSKRDTLARVRGAFRGLKQLQKPVAAGQPPIPWIVQNPFAIEDQALLFCDGWVAIVRGNPYSVEWIARSGERTAAPLSLTRTRIGTAQMQAATEAEHDKTFTPEELAPWPDFLPAFTKNALLPLPDGRIAIRRVAPSGAPGSTYDLVDRQGRLSARLELKPIESVLAFGIEAVT